MLLDGGKKTEYPEGAHACRGTYKAYGNNEKKNKNLRISLGG